MAGRGAAGTRRADAASGKPPVESIEFGQSG